jgi:DNA primase
MKIIEIIKAVFATHHPSNSLVYQMASKRTELKRSRGNIFVGLCPFHKEQTPSFTVNIITDKFHCFGCGVSGNSDEFSALEFGMPSDVNLFGEWPEKYM